MIILNYGYFSTTYRFHFHTIVFQQMPKCLVLQHNVFLLFWLGLRFINWIVRHCVFYGSQCGQATSAARLYK